MLNNQDKKIGFVLTCITFGFSLFACLISYIVFIIILYNLYYKLIQRKDRITILLCANIYLLISIFTTIVVSMNIRTILGDLYGQSFDSLSCLFSGYAYLVILCSLYMAFVNQVIKKK